MEIEVEYANLEERQDKIREVEGQGLRMLTDTYSPDWQSGQEPSGVMVFTDVMPPVVTVDPPRSSHISILVGVDIAKARPANIKRVWEGTEYFYDCFITQTVKDEYQAGKIVIGDYLLVHFDDMGEQLVTAKVYKSW